MKKLFLFTAAVIAAMTVNAKVVDLTVIGTSIDQWTISGATFWTDRPEDNLNYDVFLYGVKGGIASESFVTTEPDVVFYIKRDADKEHIFSICPGMFYQYCGKNGILIIKNTQPGDVIKLTVAAWSSASSANFVDESGAFPVNAVAVSKDLVLPAKEKGAEGADKKGYIWKVLEYVSLGGEVQIKEFACGYRIAKIEIGGGQGVENVSDGAKAVKTFENGQLVIIKNGVRYNALGAQL